MYKAGIRENGISENKVFDLVHRTCAGHGMCPDHYGSTLPTIDPNVINTLIVQTANAASTQTAAAMPTFTATSTFTPTPRPTDTPEPTATATVLFLLYAPSPVIIAQSGGNGGTPNSKPYACQVISVTPANGTSFGPRTDFDAKWKVKNIGLKDWEGNSVDYTYFSGDKIHKVAGYDLGKTVKRGDVRELIVDMLAPKKPGTYTTNWAIQVGAEAFCTLSLTIVVK